MKKNVLVIAPHPDDEVLGCGATIKKLSAEGNNVYVLVASRGSARLYNQERVEHVRLEAIEAHKILGVKDTLFLEFPAPELDTIPLADISREFSKVINSYRIDCLFLPHRGDLHNDHRVVFKAGLVAARPVGEYTVKEIYAYETLSETEWAEPYASEVFFPTKFIDATKTFEYKLKAMTCFESQLKAFPNPRSIKALTALAEFRGATVGLELAESFIVIRQIE